MGFKTFEEFCSHVVEKFESNVLKTLNEAYEPIGFKVKQLPCGFERFEEIDDISLIVELEPIDPNNINGWDNAEQGFWLDFFFSWNEDRRLSVHARHFPYSFYKDARNKPLREKTKELCEYFQRVGQKEQFLPEAYGVAKKEKDETV